MAILEAGRGRGEEEEGGRKRRRGCASFCIGVTGVTSSREKEGMVGSTEHKIMLLHMYK